MANNVKVIINRNNLMKLPDGMCQKIQKCESNIWFEDMKLAVWKSVMNIMQNLSEVMHVIISDFCFLLQNAIIQAWFSIICNNT